MLFSLGLVSFPRNCAKNERSLKPSYLIGQIIRQGHSYWANNSAGMLSKYDVDRIPREQKSTNSRPSKAKLFNLSILTVRWIVHFTSSLPQKGQRRPSIFHLISARQCPRTNVSTWTQTQLCDGGISWSFPRIFCLWLQIGNISVVSESCCHQNRTQNPSQISLLTAPAKLCSWLCWSMRPFSVGHRFDHSTGSLWTTSGHCSTIYPDGRCMKKKDTYCPS